MLIHQFHSLLGRWRAAFPQARSHRRAIEHAIALPCVFGRRTVSRTICALGRSQQDWSADYKVFSRSRWDQDRLFEPVIDEYLVRYPKGPVVAAVDDTNLRKTGKKIKGAQWLRDPLSPPFHVNLMYGLRFVQISMLFQHYREGDFAPRGIPVRFQEAPPVKKPGKRATAEQVQEYNKLKKQKNLPTQTLEMIRGFRSSLDERGGADRRLLLVLDGSFCNRTMFRAKLDRTDLIARCRKDARLCFPAPPGGRRKYDPNVFTPEEVRTQQDIPWKSCEVYVGGKRRPVRYKEVKGVLWKRGGGTTELRLIVIAPTPYKLSKNSRINYRKPAYFLTTDNDTPAKTLVQPCFDRWQIEINHRDEKDILGVGQAQVTSEHSIPRHPALAVASYSMLLLAALREFGPGRTDDYPVLPKWRKDSKRASFLDIVTRLRADVSNEASVSLFLNHNFYQNLARFADT
ncbi:MAG TPA: transposase [Acidobacteriota bacterium]|nr:transposase [Acidobacteriota bacterium]